MTTINPSNAFAANAYRIAQSLGRSSSPVDTGSKMPDFSGMVKEALGSVVNQGRASEAKQMAMASGKADIVDVVTAVAETEVALETMVSIRDRVITAYEEIMRMPI